MGLEIDRDRFVESDFVRFEQRLRDSLAALHAVLQRSDFGLGPTTIGSELELDLVDRDGRPALVNREVLARTLDPRVTLEIDRFNLEINSAPVLLAGDCFTTLARALSEDLKEVERAAATCGARVATIGILPTLTEGDLKSSALTDGNRYRALSAGLRRLRREPFMFDIEGQDRLSLMSDDVAFEGANTSLQVHLRVEPAAFANLYNAAQIAIAPVLAIAANSPLFLGRRLWDETRVVLFRQAVDDRHDGSDDGWRNARVSFGHGWVRHGAHELFAESVVQYDPLLPVLGAEDPLAVIRAGGTPMLAELRLHQGTVWRWNRAVYDGSADGHLRIEMRALPSGPTPSDMVANAAFLIGLTLALADDIDDLLNGLTFGQARRNFYEAARRGLDADLLWPATPGGRAQPTGVRNLVERLLPQAARALVRAGVPDVETERWLGIISERTRCGQTGARWQRRVFDRLRASGTVEQASRDVLALYLSQSATRLPVHEWTGA
jgi:hypothetical protein